MNECEQLHPLLKGYLEDRLSARDRRLVARHLNLCASARKEMDRLRSGGVKTPVVSATTPSEPWDLKILRWLFKTPPVAKRKEEPPKSKPSKQAESKPVGGRKSSFKPIFGIVLFFAMLILLTHFIQNAGDNRWVKGIQHYLSQKGVHFFGTSSSLDMVLDLTNLPHWNGTVAPVAFPYREIITDPDRFKIYWALLQPQEPIPTIDFNKEAVIVAFVGIQKTTGFTNNFKRMENYSDKTLYWYDEVTPTSGESIQSVITRPWVLQVVPKPVQQPALIQKIQ